MRATLHVHMNPDMYLASGDTLSFLSGAGIAFLFPLIVALAVWTIAIKGLALWHAARNGQKLWFVVLLVLNTLGILELVYLLGFRKDKQVLIPDVQGVENK